MRRLLSFASAARRIVTGTIIKCTVFTFVIELFNWLCTCFNLFLVQIKFKYKSSGYFYFFGGHRLIGMQVPDASLAKPSLQ